MRSLQCFEGIAAGDRERSQEGNREKLIQQKGILINPG
jgi:hypothetical protein